MRSECATTSRPVLKGYDPVENVMYLYQPRCKLWTCPHCASVNKSQWAVRIYEGIAFYEALGTSDWTFVTITSNPKNLTRSQCLYVWPKAWAKLGARMRRRYKNIRYVLLPELHKNGRVHVHAIASNGITTGWLKKNAPQCGLGYKSESESIAEPAKAAWYCAKYLTKSQGITNWPKYFRRIRTSQKWPAISDNSEFEKLEIDWEYYQTYDADGVGYLALMLEEQFRIPVKVLN